MNLNSILLSRLSTLDISKFKTGEIILFCPSCEFQSTEPCAMRPECPDCGRALHYVEVDAELRELTTRKLPAPRTISDRTCKDCGGDAEGADRCMSCAIEKVREWKDLGYVPGTHIRFEGGDFG